MADNANGTEEDPTPPRVRCRECLKEIPSSEAEQPEAEEYALYFCGLECFQKWHERAEKEIARREGDNQD
ncbi:hypothetical protein TVNIR_0319 [Thioalkalivibrio nitratireducens DSM 14787]|uniref:DUF3330 domain-containing protein n=1 Tax=Thioalkalivibrio nitratireducens (strain DSM 14787 / UNIQEM 213 / ALEN2) TaxID=1255043 RepID=L0DSP1_THIND|nr:DUF3330 domain-containing protein [Thioalkalivibrio nitratireducens]AGA32028.1 hypothetical protein TVNIR_0319 [Thioalkalivibrio nitratireducens DSM 14787]